MSQNILADDHVAHLGAELFSRYLIPVEVAGTLLLVALVGAVAMVESTKYEKRRIKASAGNRRDGMPSASMRTRKESVHE